MNIQPSMPAARAKIPTKAVTKVQRYADRAPFEKQGDPVRVKGEVERNEKGREGVFPGLHRGLVGVASGQGRGGKRGEGRRRRDFGEDGIVEDEHVGGEIGDAELDQRRRGDHRADDVGGRDGDGQPDHPDDHGRKDGGEKEIAPGVIDHDGAELKPQTGQGDHADDDARGGAGGGHRKDADRAAAQGGNQLPGE